MGVVTASENLLHLALAYDPEPVEAVARDWRAVAEHGRQAAENFDTAVAAVTAADWHGRGRASFDSVGDTYRDLLDADREQAEAAANALETVARLTRLARLTARVYGVALEGTACEDTRAKIATAAWRRMGELDGMLAEARGLAAGVLAGWG